MTNGLHARVMDQIGEDLVSGALPAGTVLSMEQLEARYSVSRTVVREVVKVLESRGVVTSRRKVGVSVQPPSAWAALDAAVVRWRLAGPERADQLRFLSELRSGVEPVAASLAAGRATAEQCGVLTGAVIGMSVTGRAGDLEAYLEHDATFHRTLLAASGNPMFASLGDLVAEVLAGRTRHRLMPARPEPAAIRWHGDVAQAIAQGDAATAERAARQIVVESLQAMEQLIGGVGGAG